MAKVIVGIHGLGNKPPKETLEKWWQSAIEEGLYRINPVIEMPKFELVYWADILNEQALDLTIHDNENPLFLSEPYSSTLPNFKVDDHPLKKKVFDFVEGHLDDYFLNDDLSSKYSFFSDAVIKKYFREVDVYFTRDCEDAKGDLCHARDLIKSRFIEVISKYQEDEIILVSHSMGTIIAYDVLTFVHPEFQINTFVTMGSPLGLPFIVSKIAEEENFKLSGGKKLVAPPGIKHQWLNFTDPDDKIAFDHTLNDDYLANDKGIRAKDISIVNDYVFNGVRNPHKSFGYLRSPEFSAEIIKFIKGERTDSIGTFKKIKRFFKSLI